MYFRTKSIKGTPLVQLVESFRNTEGQPRQRVVASLGDAQLPQDELPIIAKTVEARLKGQASLLDPTLSEAAAAWVTQIVQLAGRSKVSAPASDTVVDGVLIDQVTSEDIVQFGPQLVALEAWNALGLTPMLETLGLNASTVATLQLMVSNRLIAPLSEWALIDWAPRTSLPEMLDLRITKQGKDRLYRASDELLKHRKTIEMSLRERERDLFSLSRSVILYDVTNTHFEGICARNPKAKHGKNKQHRNDCRQVAVGVAFDEHGMPLAHEVFEGNMSDTKTLAAILDRLSVCQDGLKPVVILDAGFASKSNIALLRERGYSYLINITRGSRSKYADSFETDGFEVLPGRKLDEPVEVKKIPDPEDAESQLVLCRSAQRRLKEEAMVSRAEERFLADVEALSLRIKKGLLKTPAIIERRIGSLQKKHPRVQRFYKITLQKGELSFVRDDDKIQEALALCGDYVLKTDKTLSAPELWSLYMTLLRAEDGFAMLKGTLGLRPNHHHTDDRVQGHIFISVLAYHLLCWVRYHFDKQGDRREWKTICRILSTHSLVSTRLPLMDGRILRIRKPSEPDPEQQRIYKILGIDWKGAFAPRKSEIKNMAVL